MVIVKICNRCKVEKSIEDFHKDQLSKDKKRNTCKQCAKLIHAKLRSSITYVAQERIYNQKYHQNNRVAIRTRKRHTYDKEYSKRKNHEWQKNNRERANFLAARKKARKREATPRWLTRQQWEEIWQLYKDCPRGYHVDHIVPLKAVEPTTNRHIACGLHVPWNLQHLSKSENHKKKNRLYDHIQGS